MIKSIMKRDGRVVLYDESKIASAILKALEAAREGDASVAAQVANSVEARLEELCGDGTPRIEQIQDMVEQELMKFDEDNNKFHPCFPVSKLRVCLTWQNAKDKGLID